MSGVNDRQMLRYLDGLLAPKAATVPAPTEEATRVVAASARVAFPTDARPLPVLVKKRPVADLAVYENKLDRLQTLPFKRPLPINRLPIDVHLPPIRQPQRPSPLTVRGGTLYLVPDEARAVMYYLQVAPRVLSLSVQIDVDADGRTTGGSLTLIVGLHAEVEPTDATLASEGQTAAEQAGYPVQTWNLRRLPISRVSATLDLPTGHAASPPTVSGNADAASATFLVALSPLGAQTFRAAYADLSFGVPGLCRVSSVYTAQDASGRATLSELTHEVALRELVQAAGSSALRQVSAEHTAGTTLVVDADPTVEAVVVELQASSGATRTSTFGAEGGSVSVNVVAATLASEQVRWTATVSYRIASWPPIRTSGVLSAETGWSTLIKPSSWRREVRFTAILLGADGRPIREEDASMDRVTGTLDFKADFLTGVTGLQNSFDTQTQVMVTTLLPQPPGSAAGTLKLTVFALRDGRDQMVVREIGVDESWVLARIQADGRIDLITNLSPTSESDRDAASSAWMKALTTDDDTYAAHVSARGDATGVSFDVAAGPGRFWALEVASEPSLLLPARAEQRTRSSYFVSCGATPLALAEGDRYRLPSDVFTALRAHGRLYYRLWTSAVRDAWQAAEVTVSDALIEETPFVLVPS